MILKKTVALIFGGEGYESRISEISAENLGSMINGEVYDILYVGITKNGEWYIYTGEADKIGNGNWILEKNFLIPTYPVKIGECSGFIAKERIISVSCAIPCLHGDCGEDGIIQGALSAAHISYIGQDVYASALTSDKSYSKLVAEYLDIPTARWILEVGENPEEARRRAEKEIGYPMFLKPARLGSSYGAHPVNNSEDFARAFRDAKNYGGRVLIEELINTEYELECALLDTDKRYISPFGRVLSDGSFYDFRAKYEGENSPITEAKRGADCEVERKVADYAEKLANFIGLRHLSRIDFFVTKEKTVYFNEINAFPGMTSTSLYPALTEYMGLGRGDFVNLLIGKACSDDRRI